MKTIITITVHDRIDPACVKHTGERDSWGFNWLHRCHTCRQQKSKD